jgi:hypothetical protein
MKGRVGLERMLERSGQCLPKEAEGPCMLCGDPDTLVEPHAEDYSKPYKYVLPNTYWLCRYCHRTMLHKRFLNPARWAAYLAHVRRGGYGREFHDDRAINKEIAAFIKARGNNEVLQLRRLRAGRVFNSSEWWDRLTMDPACVQPGYPKPVTSVVDRFDCDETNVTVTRPAS